MIQNEADNAALARKRLPVKQEQAAMLFAADSLSGAKIAAEVGVAPATIDRWKQQDDFKAAIADYAADFCTRVRSQGIARLETRVNEQNGRWRKLQSIIEARADSMGDETPGGDTGLLVRQVKFVKVFVPTKAAQKKLETGEVELGEVESDAFIATKETQAVYEYAVDTGLLAEMRAIEAQAAKELGQLIERSESKISGDVTADMMRIAAAGCEEKFRRIMERVGKLQD